MSSFNVRLSPEDEQAVARLQRDNINVSQLLRDAIRSADAERRSKASRITAADIRRVFEKIDAVDVPTPDWIEEGVDVSDRKQANAYRRRDRTRRDRRYEVFEQ